VGSDGRGGVWRTGGRALWKNFLELGWGGSSELTVGSVDIVLCVVVKAAPIGTPSGPGDRTALSNGGGGWVAKKTGKGNNRGSERPTGRRS